MPHKLLKTLSITLLFLSPIYSFCQGRPQLDSLEQKIVHEDCEDKVFVKVETLPSMKKGIKNFEDTLASGLNWKNVFQRDTTVTFRFLLTTSSHIFDISKESGNINNEWAIEEFLISHAWMWRSAVQNDRLVCAYVRLVIEYVEGKIRIAIKQ